MRTFLRLILCLLLFGAVAHARGAASADDLLEPEKAFRFSARALDARTLEVTYRIEPGYYLYREKFRFSIEPATAGKLAAPRFPAGEIHQDAFFGKTETYRKAVRIELPLDGEAASGRFTLKAVSQGCADVGVCYVPNEQRAEIRLASASGGGAATGGGLLERLTGPASVDKPLPSSGHASASAGFDDETRFVAALESGGLLLALGLFFVAGLALTFTPCVLPMIPILSGIIVGEGRKATRREAFLLSLAYVAGMSVTYTAIGVAAAMSGQLLSAALQNAWVLSAFAIVFVLLALSMFGFYDLRLPSGMHAHLTAASHRLPGGHFGGVVIMGALSAAIVSPCVAAPLAGALLYISQTRDAVLGGGALFAMALGMGVPLILVGVTEGAFLPKSGPWMKSVQRFFGALLLGVAIWIVSPVIPVAVQMLAWAALAVVSAMYLRAFDSLPQNAPGSARFWKGVGWLLLIVGAAQAVGALSGSRDVLQPLAGLRASAGQSHDAPRFERVRSVEELDARLKLAGRPVMLDFYADWCVSCKEMERFTFTDPQVRSKMETMLLLQADVTANTEADKALLRRFRLFGPPGIIFFDARGQEIPGVRVIGYQPAGRFVATLDRVTGP